MTLETRVFPHHDALGAAAADEAERVLRRAHEEGRTATVLLAAAPSQLPVLRALATRDVHDRPTQYFHMDEYVGIDPNAPQAFGRWLEENYFAKLPQGHRATFERIPSAEDLEEVAATYAEQLPEGNFDLVLCGIGQNGHLAFNDPGCDLRDPLDVRLIELAIESRQQQVDEGLFPELSDVPEAALTITVPRLLRADRVLCSVLGEGKATALAALRAATEVTNELPATALMDHSAATVFADSAAVGHDE